MATIPVQLNDIDLAKLDFLIRLGKYKNRTQAIKTIIQSKLEQESFPFEWDSPSDREKRQEIIQQILQNNSLKIEIQSKKNAVELVREQRDR
jgi:hypothetical protein